MDAEQLIEEVGLVSDALWVGVLRPESLPSIATDLLVRGADTPALRNLAGFDLRPFDPRDAADMFGEVVAETATPIVAAPGRLGRAAHVLATVWSEGVLSSGAILKCFFELAVAMDYPDHEQVMRLYSLEDEWSGEWGRTRAEIEAEVAGIMTALSADRPAVPLVILEAIAQY